MGPCAEQGHERKRGNTRSAGGKEMIALLQCVGGPMHDKAIRIIIDGTKPTPTESLDMPVRVKETQVLAGVYKLERRISPAGLYYYELKWHKVEDDKNLVLLK